MAFRIGQPVVVVDDSPSCLGYSPPFRKGERVTIAAVKEFWDGFGVDLVEYPRASLSVTEHTLYTATRFRAIVERKTDISIFKEILDRENHGLPSRVDYPCDVEGK